MAVTNEAPSPAPPFRLPGCCGCVSWNMEKDSILKKM